MKNSSGKRVVILRVILSVILFSLFIKIDSIFSVMNTLADRDWSLLVIILAAVLIRMTFAGFVVLIILPMILGLKVGESGYPDT